MTHGEIRNAYNILSEHLKVHEHLGDLDVK
jgi:hypothetical protein